jgi:hypothetical protein
VVFCEKHQQSCKALKYAFFALTGNLYGIAELLIHWTGLRERNPDIDVNVAMMNLAFCRMLYQMYTTYRRLKGTSPWGPYAFDSWGRIGVTAGTLLVNLMRDVHGRIPCFRDHLRLLGILFLSALLVNVSNIWTITCEHMGIDPAWLVEALYGKHVMLGIAMTVVWGMSAA